MITVEAFDPYKEEHVLAYKIYLDTGKLPVGFIEHSCLTLPTMQYKLAKAWTEEFLTKSTM